MGLEDLKEISSAMCYAFLLRLYSGSDRMNEGSSALETSDFIIWSIIM